MAGPSWALLALVGIPLLQIPLVLYLSRWFELDGDGVIQTQARVYWSRQAGEVDGGPLLEDRPGHCRRCGADNDPTYTFCGSCVARL